MGRAFGPEEEEGLVWSGPVGPGEEEGLEWSWPLALKRNEAMAGLGPLGGTLTLPACSVDELWFTV